MIFHVTCVFLSSSSHAQSWNQQAWSHGEVNVADVVEKVFGKHPYREACGTMMAFCWPKLLTREWIHEDHKWFRRGIGKSSYIIFSAEWWMYKAHIWSNDIQARTFGHRHSLIFMKNWILSYLELQLWEKLSCEQRFLVGRFSLYKVCLVKCWRRHFACARRLFVGILRMLVNMFFCVGGLAPTA